MAIHSSILAWRIPWTEEPGGLQSVRLHRIRHDWAPWETLWKGRERKGSYLSLLRLCNKIPQTAWLKRRILIWHSFGGWKPKMKEPADPFRVRALFLACRQPPSPVSSCGRQRVSSLVSSHGGTNPIMTSSKPNRPKGLVSTISLQVGPQQLDLGGTQTFSPWGLYHTRGLHVARLSHGEGWHLIGLSLATGETQLTMNVTNFSQASHTDLKSSEGCFSVSLFFFF